MKRSITISGHSTSIFIEAEFWQALKEISAQKGISVPALIGEIDMDSANAEGVNHNLSSRIRVYVLEYYKKRCEDKEHKLNLILK
jgi:predicted DNA-binding ribbon-helix-helix protein